MMMRDDPGNGTAGGTQRGTAHRSRAIAARVRARERSQLQCAYAARLCRAIGLIAWHEFQHEAGRCIRASARLDGIRIAFSINVSRWVARTFGEHRDAVGSIAFDSVLPAYLLAMFEADIQARTTQVGRHALTDWRVHSIDEGPAARWVVMMEDSAGVALTVRASPDRIVDACLSRMLREPHLRANASIDRIPVPIALCVGRSRARSATLSQFERGDLLIVQSVEWGVQVGRYRLGRFITEGERWKMEQTPHEPAHHRAAVPDICAIPIELEFVLDRVSMTIGDLHRLCAGATFPLTPAATMRATVDHDCAPCDTDESDELIRYRIQICANGQPIGEGELVALGDGLAVEIVRLDPGSEEFDACKATSV